jgi:hypothetical protein
VKIVHNLERLFSRYFVLKNQYKKVKTETNPSSVSLSVAPISLPLLESLLHNPHHASLVSCGALTHRLRGRTSFCSLLLCLITSPLISSTHRHLCHRSMLLQQHQGGVQERSWSELRCKDVFPCPPPGVPSIVALYFCRGSYRIG